MATAIRPEDLPAAPALSATDALIVDTGDGVFKTTPQAIAEAVGAVTEDQLAASDGGSLVGMPGGKTLALAALLTATGGLTITGKNGSGERPEGQLALINDPTNPGHTIISLINQIATEECAVESIGFKSNGASQQQGAWFWKWVDSDNDPATYEAVNVTHLVKAGQDNTPLEIWGRNSVRVCRGDTASISWDDPPPANVFEVYTSGHVGNSWTIGANVDFTPAAGFVFEAEGFGQFGLAASGSITKSVQIGYTAGGNYGFIQAYDTAGSVFRPLVLSGSTVRMGDTGQQVGFMGATPVSRPTITGSRGGNVALASLLTALAALGLVTDTSTA